MNFLIFKNNFEFKKPNYKLNQNILKYYFHNLVPHVHII